MGGSLHAAWNAPAAVPGPPRWGWRDGALLGIGIAAAVIEGALRTDLSRPALSVAALVAVLPTLLWRRTHPLMVLTIMFVATTPLQLIAPDEVLYTSALLIVNAYALFRWGSGRALLVGTPLLAVGLAMSFLRDGVLEDLVAGAAVLLALALAGMGFRSRAASQMREVEGIRTLERERLARDLHDTVAHHVAAIAIRAQAGLAVAPQDPAAAAAALEVIEQEAATTLDELRSMVGVLRQDEVATRAPTARLSDIEDLAGLRPGGVTVTVQLIGDTDVVPPVVAGAAFRIAQESVTNALRHAHGLSAVDVVAESDGDGVRLRVIDDGEPASASDAGFGIIGMTERAVLLGGTLHAGPAARGGWEVTALLPRAG